MISIEREKREEAPLEDKEDYNFLSLVDLKCRLKAVMEKSNQLEDDNKDGVLSFMKSCNFEVWANEGFSKDEVFVFATSKEEGRRVNLALIKGIGDGSLKTEMMNYALIDSGKFSNVKLEMLDEEQIKLIGNFDDDELGELHADSRDWSIFKVRLIDVEAYGRFVEWEKKNFHKYIEKFHFHIDAAMNIMDDAENKKVVVSEELIVEESSDKGKKSLGQIMESLTEKQLATVKTLLIKIGLKIGDKEESNDQLIEIIFDALSKLSSELRSESGNTMDKAHLLAIMVKFAPPKSTN